jgi:hypothetical protein
MHEATVHSKERSSGSATPAPLRLLLLGACAVFLALVASSSTLAVSTPAGAATSAPRLANPTAVGRTLVVRYFVLLQRRDVAGLSSFLSPAFQLQRADGSGDGKTAYLHDLPSVENFRLTNVAATQAGSVLVVRYLATVTGEANGKPYTPGPAPRLSVFSWNGSRWQLIAHSNFNPLTG